MLYSSADPTPPNRHSQIAISLSVLRCGHRAKNDRTLRSGQRAFIFDSF